MSTNPHYRAWVAATGGGPNWQYMKWITGQKKIWLIHCIDPLSGVPVCTFTEWLCAQHENKARSKMTNERKNITQPADWWAAFESEAKRRELTLSEFIGLAASKMIPKDERSKLSERVKPGRKKNED
jgi:hypothetical protein